MTNEKVLAAVTALCKKYSSPPVPGQEVIMGGQAADEVGVIRAANDLTKLSGKLGLSIVYPALSSYLSQLGKNDVKFIKRKDLVKMLIDGMPALSDAYEESNFIREYGKDLADHVDYSKVLAREFDS